MKAAFLILIKKLIQGTPTIPELSFGRNFYINISLLNSTPKIKSWKSYRYAIAHYKNFDSRPQGKVEHYSEAEIGKTAIQEIKSFPGYFNFEPKLSSVYGKLTEKMEYGPPNYGQTSDKDAKISVYVLTSEMPLQVFSMGSQDSEIGDRVEKDLQEIHVYTTDKKLLLKKYMNKKITLVGFLQTGRTGGVFTKIGMDVKEILE